MSDRSSDPFRANEGRRTASSRATHPPRGGDRATEGISEGTRFVPSRRATPREARPLSEWDTRPRILVTNDDGIESRGLLKLRQALDAIGETFVLAPETNQSAVGHAKTYMRPLRIRERTMADGSVGWSVDGSPTDAVSLAFLGYFGVNFDLVASGINYGSNLGDDVTYSGTVSAAMEAVLSGCPAFAMSQEFDAEPDFELAGRMAQLAARNIFEHGLGEGELLNINVPLVAAGQCEGIEVTRMGKRVYQDQLIERLDPRGTPYYWFGGPPPSGLVEPGTDFHAVANRRIAVTPIHLDLTSGTLLDRLDGWSWRMDAERADESVSADGAEPAVDGAVSGPTQSGVAG